jgi:hypothetical protein
MAFGVEAEREAAFFGALWIADSPNWNAGGVKNLMGGIHERRMAACRRSENMGGVQRVSEEELKLERGLPSDV